MKRSLFPKLSPWVTGTLPCLLFLTGTLHAQTDSKITVSGKIKAENDNAPLIGATIAEKGTNTGTTADVDGNYKISVAQGASIVVSFIGYVPQEIKVDNRSVIDVTLKADQQQLQDVVVVGYGTARKKDLTGSIAKISSEQLIQPSAGSFDQMLQGKVPGVQISQTTGAPGGNVNIYLPRRRCIALG